MIALFTCCFTCNAEDKMFIWHTITSATCIFFLPMRLCITVIVFPFTYTRSIILSCYSSLFQSFCLINNRTVTSPVETFPSLTFTGYFKSNLSFGSVSRWIVSSFSSVSLCSPLPYPIESVRLPPPLGLFHLIRPTDVRALSWINTVISWMLKLFFFFSLHYNWYHC